MHSLSFGGGTIGAGAKGRAVHPRAQAQQDVFDLSGMAKLDFYQQEVRGHGRDGVPWQTWRQRVLLVQNFRLFSFISNLTSLTK